MGKSLPPHSPKVAKKIRFPETSGFGIKPVSKEGTQRLVDAAISYALKQNRRSAIYKLQLYVFRHFPLLDSLVQLGSFSLIQSLTLFHTHYPPTHLCSSNTAYSLPTFLPYWMVCLLSFLFTQSMACIAYKEPDSSAQG